MYIKMLPRVVISSASRSLAKPSFDSSASNDPREPPRCREPRRTKRAAVDSNVERFLLPYIATERKWPISSMITGRLGIRRIADRKRIAAHLFDFDRRRLRDARDVDGIERPARFVRLGFYMTRVQRYLLQHLKGKPGRHRRALSAELRWDEEFVRCFKPGCW